MKLRFSDEKALQKEKNVIYYIEDLLDKKEEGRALEMDESLNRQSRGKVWFGALGILLSVAVGGALAAEDCIFFHCLMR